MEFLEGIGQRYLERKAYAVPQQLENLAKKQFAPAAAETKPTVQATTALPATKDKDRELRALRKQLADAKAERQSLPRKAIGTSNARDLSTEMKTSKQPKHKRESVADCKHTGSPQETASERRRSIASSQAARDKYAATARSSSQAPSVEIEKSHPAVTQVDETTTRREPPKVESMKVRIQSSARREPLNGTTEPDVCAVYVEEEAPRRRRVSTKDVIEVSSSHGRTIYRIR